LTDLSVHLPLTTRATLKKLPLARVAEWQTLRT
jgi:hypothetical protein